MTIKYFPDMLQGSEEWFDTRRGLLTASEMKLIITPAKLEYSISEKEKLHLYELAAQRTSGYVEPHFIGDHMMMGKENEVLARQAYSKRYAPVTECGFITNDKWGFTLGYSPDGLVGEDGQIEAKSRVQKYQFETIITPIPPAEYSIQLQTGLLISERKWCDFLSYPEQGGLPMKRIRVLPDEKVQAAILAAAFTFHQRLGDVMKKYQECIAADDVNLTPTERRKIVGSMLLGETT